MVFSFRLIAAACGLAGLLSAQEPDWKQVLERLERLEQENKSLREEVRLLKARLDGPGPPLEERVQVQEARVDEHAQTKVESSARVPVRLTGMLLFNMYSGGRSSIPERFPTIAGARDGTRQIRGTFAQTAIGIQVDSPVTIAGAQARGEVIADFYGEYDEYIAPRLRTGFLDLSWKTRSIRVGVEKPIVAPRNPVSLAQMVYPALWGAGNLWFWEPQARVEQRFGSETTDVRAQFGLFQSRETAPNGPDSARPSWQSRVQFGHKFSGEQRIEFAPGFAYSRTLVANTTVPSRLITADFLLAPSRWWEFSGAYFHGENAAPLGGLRQGVTVFGERNAQAVGTWGGWGQLLFRPFDRFRIHAMAGQQDDNDRHLIQGNIGRNASWALNGIWQLSPNVLLGLELQQIRTTYLGRIGTRVLNRYDLALAYQF